MGSNTQFKLCGICKCMIPLSNKRARCGKCASKERKLYVSQATTGARYREAEKVYNSTRYKKARTECKKRARGMCEVCYHFGKRKLGDHAHHIIKVLEGDESTHYDIDNLIYVCAEHHKILEKMRKEEIIDYLETGGI